MLVTISPSQIHGRISANPSKSHAQRAIAIAALTHGTSLLAGLGDSDDVTSALRIAQAMGVLVEPHEDALRITGGRPILSPTWDCGESGLCLRMFAAIAALYDQEITLTAHDTLLARPIGFMSDPLHQLGVAYASDAGLPPVKIKGPYRNRQATLDGSISSQFLTGLLIALPIAAHNSTLKVNQLKSKPYIDLTLATLQSFGVELSHENYEIFHIPGRQAYQPVTLQIQGDWSGMAFTLVAAALAGEITITGLPSPDAQADGRILEFLVRVGAGVQFNGDTLGVQKGGLCAFECDCTDCPDLFPPLVVLATSCDGVSRINGVHRLKTKESDRGKMLIQEFQKLGVHIWQDGDALLIEGGRIHGGKTDAHGDHRIAMALAIAGLVATSAVEITGAECVSKSYPDFFQDLEVLGARIEY